MPFPIGGLTFHGRTLEWRALGDHDTMNFRHWLAASLCLVAAFSIAASPALADRCDDLAGQLKSQIDGCKSARPPPTRSICRIPRPDN